MIVFGFVVSNGERKIFIHIGTGGKMKGGGGEWAYATNEPPVLLQSSVLYVFMQE